MRMSIDSGADLQVLDSGADLQVLDGGSDAAADGSVDAPDAANVTDAAQPDAEPTCTDDKLCVISAVHECIGAHLVETSSCDKGCVDGACNAACDVATLAIDQSQADDHAMVGSATQWQTFKVAETGVLTALELRPNVYSATGDPSLITLSIYVGEGIAGARIARQEYTLASAAASPWQTFELTLPVPLQAEQTYTWAVDGAKSLYYAEADVYPGGHAKFAARDMTFRVHSAACH